MTCQRHPSSRRNADGDCIECAAERTAKAVAEEDGLREVYRPLRETTASIAAWQNETFGPAETTRARFERTMIRFSDAEDAVRDMDWDPAKPRPNLSRAIRAAEELAELIELLVADDNDPKACAEVADIEIVLAGIPAAHGTEQTDNRDAKMAINRARRWSTSGDGHGQHVEDEK